MGDSAPRTRIAIINDDTDFLRLMHDLLQEEENFEVLICKEWDHAYQFVHSGNGQVEQRVHVVAIQPGAVIQDVAERRAISSDPPCERARRVQLQGVDGEFGFRLESGRECGKRLDEPAAEQAVAGQHVADTVADSDRRYIEWAIASARRRRAATEASVFDFVRAALLLELPAPTEGQLRAMRSFRLLSFAVLACASAATASRASP